jgi:membrane-bound serine protease (ClpP class)
MMHQIRHRFRRQRTRERPASLPRYLLALCAISFGVGFAATGPAADGSAEVWVVDLDGALGPATGDLLIRSIDAAAAASAKAIIIRMDTPGGLDKAMRDVIKKILAAEIPVVTFVSPDGARAASAGTYIATASHIAAMAPATNIGSSTPVTIGAPTPTPAVPGAEDSEQAAAAPQDAMMRKIVNDSVAYLQSLAELRGRNIEWAETTVREGANLRASEALANNVIDLISADLDSLMQDIDGIEVEIAGRVVVLETADATLHFVETDWRHDLLKVVTDPTIAYGLLIFGIYGLILEFYNPGMVAPAVIGIICLLLGAYGLQMLPINYAGLALIVVGIVMMVMEFFTPTMGILGIAGIAAFVFGSVILMDTEVPGYTLPLAVIGAFTASTVVLVMVAIGAAVRARASSIRTGREAMVGAPAQALEEFQDSGHVRAFGEIWQARSDVPVGSGEYLEVIAVDELTLVVKPREED